MLNTADQAIIAAIVRDELSRMKPADELLTAEKAGELLGVTVDVINQRARVGAIPGKKFQNRWYFHKNELIEAVMR